MRRPEAIELLHPEGRREKCEDCYLDFDPKVHKKRGTRGPLVECERHKGWRGLIEGC